MNSLDTIRRIMDVVLCIDPCYVKPESKFRDDFMVDELDMIELFDYVERIFSISLLDKALDSVKTVQDLVVCVERALGGTDNAPNP